MYYCYRFCCTLVTDFDVLLLPFSLQSRFRFCCIFQFRLHLVLDEATSALDSESERSIKNIVSHLKEMGKTVILIAHRLGTVMNSDEIFVLKEGKLVEQGSHTELIDKAGEYARFWKAQTEA